MDFRRNLSNMPGWRTRRKIVVIESDDWGSIRMPSGQTYEKLERLGLDLSAGDSGRYNRYDTLATPDDLSLLFDVLSSVKDKNNNPAVFTAVSVVANPDFEKIRSHDFQEYFYEPFTETLNKYPQRENSFHLWLEGRAKQLFVPQFHGREHLNVTGWLKALQQGHRGVLAAFEQGMWGFSPDPGERLNVALQAAFDLESTKEIPYQSRVIAEGLHLFEDLLGYKATYFVPPNGPYCRCLDKVAAEHGIRYVSTAKIHCDPPGAGPSKREFHWLGKENSFGQRYITRNCFFEPSQKGRDWVNTCLQEIEIAFRWHKPAIVSSHRVNYIGAIDPANRDKGLKQLELLLSVILNKWPDVEFMTSDALGDLISGRAAS